MKTLRKSGAIVIALLCIFVLAFQVVLAKVDVSSHPHPHSNPCTSLEECQERVYALEDQVYENGLMPYTVLEPAAPTVVPTAQSTTVNSTADWKTLSEGQPAPAEVDREIHRYLGKLNEIALGQCTIDDYRLYYFNGAQIHDDFIESANWMETREGVDYADIKEELNSYLQQQQDLGYAVPLRAPHLYELMLQYPKCDTGEYTPPSK